MEEGNINVHEAQAGDQTFKRWLVPDRFEVRIEALEVIKRPGIQPRNYDQKQPDFEGEYGETDRQKAALPTPWSGRSLLNRRGAFR